MKLPQDDDLIFSAASMRFVLDGKPVSFLTSMRLSSDIYGDLTLKFSGKTEHGTEESSIGFSKDGTRVIVKSIEMNESFLTVYLITQKIGE